MHSATPARFLIGEIEVDLVNQTVGDSPMTEMDAALLTALASRKGEVATKEELYREVWGYRSIPKGRALDFAIRRLRDKVEADPKNPQYLEIVRGRGFRLRWEQKPVELTTSEAFDPPPITLDWIGSTERIEAVQSRLARAQLMTLLGPAGVGKTRLLVEAITEESDVRWIRLHELHDDFTLLAVLCQALQVAGVALSGDVKTLFVEVAESLAVRKETPLLVLDGAEAFTTSLRWILPLFLEKTALRIVVTTRQRLEVRTESLFDVTPLTAEEALQFMRIKAEDVLGMARVSDTELHALAQELDGLPLAMELAAPRLRTMRPAQLIERLQSDVQILKDAPGLLVSLPKLIAQGFEQLTDEEMMALWVLSMLRRGVTMDIAETILADLGDPLQLVTTLMDHSLLSKVDGSTDEPRFRVMGAVATTARQVLSERHPERQDDVWEALCEQSMRWHKLDGLLAVAKDKNGALRRALRSEHMHAEVWIEAMTQTGEHKAAVQLTWSFTTLFEWDGDRRRSLQLTQTVANTIRGPEYRCVLLASAAVNAAATQEWETVDVLLDRAEALCPEEGQLRGLYFLCRISIGRGRGWHDEVQEAFEEALIHFDDKKDAHWLGRLYLAKTADSAIQGATERAKEELEIARDYIKTAGGGYLKMSCFVNDAYHAFSDGDVETAAFLYRRAIRSIMPLKSNGLVAGLQRRLVHALRSLGDVPGAMRAVDEAIGLIHKDSDPTAYVRLFTLKAEMTGITDLETAISMYREAIELCAHGVDRLTALAIYNRACSAFVSLLDRPFPFHDALDEMESMAGDNPVEYTLAHVWNYRSILAARDGNVRLAVEYTERALRHMSKFERLLEIPQTLPGLALAMYLVGEIARGDALMTKLDSSDNVFWQKRARSDRAKQARALREKWVAEHGEPEAAS